MCGAALFDPASRRSSVCQGQGFSVSSLHILLNFCHKTFKLGLLIAEAVGNITLKLDQGNFSIALVDDIDENLTSISLVSAETFISANKMKAIFSPSFPTSWQLLLVMSFCLFVGISCHKLAAAAVF